MVLRVWGKPLLENPSLKRWAENMCACPWGVFAMKQRSEVTEKLISVRCPAGLFKTLKKPEPAILFLCLMKLIKLQQDIREILLQLCWKFWIRNKTIRFTTISWSWDTTCLG